MTSLDLAQGNSLKTGFFILWMILSSLSYTTNADGIINLPEIVVADSPKRNVVHMIAYVREYSSLTTYTDTVFLFREKVVDFMLPRNAKSKFRGWTNPRIITCKSYYQFTNNHGLDSVSDTYHQYFSWSDWIGLPPKTILPLGISLTQCGSDTIHGKYGPIEIWNINNDRLTIDVNVVADTIARSWVPSLKGFFRSGIDFDKLKLHYEYEDVVNEQASPNGVVRYTYQIESAAGDRVISPSGRRNEPCYITTEAEVTILDRRFITSKEAKKWENHKYALTAIEDFDNLEIPNLPPSMQILAERVGGIDKIQQRINRMPDKKYFGKLIISKKVGIGKRILNIYRTIGWRPD